MTKSTLILAAALCLATEAFGDGFFETKRDVPVATLEVQRDQDDQVKVVAVAAAACALQLRWNIATPRGLEITYIGGVCAATEETAIVAASLQPRATSKVTGEPAIPPIYQCSVSVMWEPATPSSVLVNPAGTGCENTVGIAIGAAVQAVACEHHNVPCRL